MFASFVPWAYFIVVNAAHWLASIPSPNLCVHIKQMGSKAGLGSYGLSVTLSHPCFKAKTFDAINHAKLVMVQTRQRTCPSRVPACQPKNRYIQFCQTFGKTIKDNEPTVDTSYWCKPDLIYTLFLVQHLCQCGNNRIVQYLLRSPPSI